MLRTWQDKFRSGPSWGKKDFVLLYRQVRQHREMAVEEFKARWDLFLDDSDPFIAKQGYSLAFFCLRFDAYTVRPSLELPLIPDWY